MWPLKYMYVKKKEAYLFTDEFKFINKYNFYY